MKRTILYPLLSIILIYCSSPTEISNKAISVQKNNGLLKITNNLNHDLYLFITEQEIATLINWSPHFESPKISLQNSINIPYSKIYNGKPDPVKSGDVIIIYYWDKSNQSNPVIYSKTIEL